MRDTQTIGARKHVAWPCDEEDAAGEPIRTWDVFRRGVCVASGFATRQAARQAAKELDDDRT